MVQFFGVQFRKSTLSPVRFRVLALMLCVAMPAMLSARSACAADTSVSYTAPDLTSARAKIKLKDWNGAIAELTKMAETNRHADVYNLLGFSQRKSGDYKNALVNYEKALALDPQHKGAQEYLGELYVETGQMDKAKAMLASLEALCPQGCEEREDLEEAIAAGPGTPTKSN